MIRTIAIAYTSVALATVALIVAWHVAVERHDRRTVARDADRLIVETERFLSDVIH